MGIEIIGKLTQKNNGNFKLVDLEDVDYDGTGKNAKQELEKKIEDAKITLVKDETSMEGIKDNEYPTLTTQDKTLIGAINEVNTQCKDIANSISEVYIKYPPIPLIKPSGDGITDDTNVIKNIIDFCINNNIEKIIFNEGIYLIDTLNISKGITICGTNKAIIKSKSDHETILFDKDINDVNIYNIKFNGILDNQGQSFIKFLGATNVSIHDCSFENCGGSAIINIEGLLDNFNCYNNKFINTNNGGLLLRPVQNLYIYNNYFENINGYSSSEPAHPIYIRADGIDVSNLNNVNIYNNVIQNCNLDDYSGKHAIKVVSNQLYSSGYKGKNISIKNNIIYNWSNGIHVANLNNVDISLNKIDLKSNTLTAHGILYEGCENLKIINNIFDCDFYNSSNILYSYCIKSTSSSNSSIKYNTINFVGYNAIKIDDYMNNGNIENISIESNSIIAKSNKTNDYCIVFSDNINKIKIINNSLSHDVRCLYFGASIFDDIKILNNTFIHTENEIGSAGVGIGKSSATVTNFLQCGNTFIGFNTPNSTDKDIVS